MRRSDDLARTVAKLGKQSTAAMNHGGRAVTAFSRSGLLLLSVLFYAMGKLFSGFDKWLARQSEQPKRCRAEQAAEREIA